MSKTASTDALATELIRLIKSNGGWERISAESGIPRSTLRDHLLYNRHRFTALELFRLADVLNVEPSEVV